MRIQDIMQSKLRVWVRRLIVVFFCVLGQAGCGDEWSPWPTPRPLGADIRTYRPVVESTDPKAGAIDVKEPTGALALRQALALALARNPALAAASWDVRVAEVDILQAGMAPNPEVRVRMGDFGGTGVFRGTKDSDQSIRLSQVIELGWKSSKRIRVARLETSLRGWDYEAMRLDVFTQTTKAFVGVLAAERRLAAAKEMHVVAERIMSLIAKRVAGGAAPGLEAKEARIRLGMAKTELERGTYAMTAARAGLASCWNADDPKFKQPAGDLETLTEVPPLKQLIARISGNPDLARWETEADLREAKVEQEYADRIPDLRVLGGMRRLEESGDQGYLAALEIVIPIFDWNQHGVSQARFRRIRAAHEKRAATMATTAALSTAYQILSTSYHEAILLRDVVLPAARDALKIARVDLAMKDKGEGLALPFDPLDILKAQRALFRAKTRQSDALLAYHMAVADIERLIAGPIVVAKPPKQPETRPRKVPTTQPGKN